MNLNTRATTRTVTEAAGEGAAALGDAQQQVLDAVHAARKQARSRMIQARIAAARARERGRTKTSGISKKAVAAACAAGLAVGYFLDPDAGKRRRHQARDRVLGIVRRGARKTRREAEPNDQDLADRVKSEIFQPADAPKGSVNVNVENGIVYLRGEVKRPQQVRKLIEDAESVDGVRGVESLLHTA
jgi:osmotically-inducible protein OsmY